jgi:hypothetical protein
LGSAQREYKLHRGVKLNHLVHIKPPDRPAQPLNCACPDLVDQQLGPLPLNLDDRAKWRIACRERSRNDDDGAASRNQVVLHHNCEPLATLLAAKAEGLVKEGLQEGLKILGIKSPGEGSTSNALSTNATKAPAHPGTPSPLNLGTNAVKDVEQGAGKVLDALGGFLK